MGRPSFAKTCTRPSQAVLRSNCSRIGGYWAEPRKTNRDFVLWRFPMPGRFSLHHLSARYAGSQPTLRSALPRLRFRAQRAIDASTPGWAFASQSRKRASCDRHHSFAHLCQRTAKLPLCTPRRYDPNGPASTYALIGDTRLGRLHRQRRDRRRHRRRLHQDRFRERARATPTASPCRPPAALTTTSQTFTIGVADSRADDPVGQQCRRQHRCGRRRERSDGRHHRISTDVNGPAVTLRADRRYLRRRLHHQCRDRRRHRRQFHQDRFRDRRRATPIPSPRRPATARGTARRPSPST